MRALLLAMAAYTFREATSTLATVDLGPRTFPAYDYLTRPGIVAAIQRTGATCFADVPPDSVSVRMYVERFHSVDHLHGTFGMDAYLIATWTDTTEGWPSTAQRHLTCMETLCSQASAMSRLRPTTT